MLRHIEMTLLVIMCALMTGKKVIIFCCRTATLCSTGTSSCSTGNNLADGVDSSIIGPEFYREFLECFSMTYLVYLNPSSQTLPTFATALKEQCLSLPTEMLMYINDSITHRCMYYIASRGNYVTYWRYFCYTKWTYRTSLFYTYANIYNTIIF